MQPYYAPTPEEVIERINQLLDQWAEEERAMADAQASPESQPEDADR